MAEKSKYRLAKTLLNVRKSHPKLLDEIWSDINREVLLTKNLDRIKTLYERGHQIANQMDYHDYLNSEYWLRFRAGMRRERQECSACGNEATEVHHSNYKGRLFLERIDRDVTNMCSSCHSVLHANGVRDRINCPSNPPCSSEKKEHDELIILPNKY